MFSELERRGGLVMLELLLMPSDHVISSANPEMMNFRIARLGSSAWTGLQPPELAHDKEAALRTDTSSYSLHHHASTPALPPVALAESTNFSVVNPFGPAMSRVPGSSEKP